MNAPSSVSELARRSGFPLDAAYPAVNHLRGRGYLREERRRYSLSQDGRELVAILDAARREGIQAYVDGLDARERNWLYESIRMSKAADQGQSGSEEHARRPRDLGH